MKLCRYISFVCGWLCILMGTLGMLAAIGHMYFMPYLEHPGHDFTLAAVSFFIVFGGAILYIIGSAEDY